MYIRIFALRPLPVYAGVLIGASWLRLRSIQSPMTSTGKVMEATPPTNQ